MQVYDVCWGVQMYQATIPEMSLDRYDALASEALWYNARLRARQAALQAGKCIRRQVSMHVGRQACNYFYSIVGDWQEDLK